MPLRGASPVAEAERLAAEAIALAPAKPDDALALARRALSLTADFEPTAFVRAGRKGEVVEDAYLAARLEYRRHRAGVYEAVGACLAAAGRPAEAARYLRRAVELERREERVARLARELVALGRSREALDLLLAGSPGAEALALAEAAADAAGLPSLQVEMDRVRLAALKVEARDGPFRLPERARLSTGAPLRLDGERPAVVYLARGTCGSCTADLEALQRLVPEDLSVVVVPDDPQNDHALRQAVALYRYPWPLGVGAGIAEALGGGAPRGLVVARRGWLGAVLAPPFDALPAALAALGRADVRETIPRASWNGRPPDRAARAARPGLLPDGLAPGEDEPAPEEFAAAVAAFRSGRAREALRLFESLEAKGDGWLLPPEARLDRALCLAALGRGDEARRLLLRTGDSRLQEAVDRALERVGSARAR